MSCIFDSLEDSCIPIFDSNQAQVARAEYLLTQAEKELCDIQLRIKADVISYHQELLSLQLVFNKYKETILTFHEKALAYAKDFQQVMQITIPMVIRIHKELYKAQRRLLEVIADALNTYTSLEQAVGKRLTSFMACQNCTVTNSAKGDREYLLNQDFLNFSNDQKIA